MPGCQGSDEVMELWGYERHENGVQNHTDEARSSRVAVADSSKLPKTKWKEIGNTIFHRPPPPKSFNSRLTDSYDNTEIFLKMKKKILCMNRPPAQTQGKFIFSGP